MTAKFFIISLSFASLILGAAQALPSEFKRTQFSGSDITPSPACICAHPNGDVFVGVDMLGSLGKGPGKGKIIRLRDTNQDGKADEHTVFANIDNPRGLIAIGDKLYVLHTVIPADVGKMTGMHLSLLTDSNSDGKADGAPKRLIKNISTLLHNQKRGADHTTNGIRMGIDGWIYIAIGDFGFVDAEGTDGKKLTMLGGGILRVRPDGTEMEVYTHGLRNIYDVAIDPFMNIFTRGNTNDGGGWNVRFIHQIQTGQYGYPMLFKNFTSEIIPALVDVGGGSGTGALFFQEPSWPEKYNNVPMMADWGRNELIIHRVTPDGPSFTQQHQTFIKCHQISDLDVDGSGRLFLSAWNGAGYKGNNKKGYIERVVPTNWTYKPFPNLTKLTGTDLVKLHFSASSTTRLHAQQEMLKRNDTNTSSHLLSMIKGHSNLAEGRVAAIYTYSQLLGKKAVSALLEVAHNDPTLTEHCLRAVADRKSIAQTLSPKPFIQALESDNPRVQVAAAIALGRISKKEAAKSLLTVSNPPTQKPTAKAEFLYESKIIRGKETVDIDIDINRIKTLHLIAENAGDGNSGDHIAWCEPMLVREDGTKKPLTEIKWRTAQQAWGKTHINQSCNGKPLVRADGTTVQQGIGSHAYSVIGWAKIPFEFVRLQVTGSLTNTAPKGGSVRFMIGASAPPKQGQTEGPHSTPNADTILPHVAVQSLISLKDTESALQAIPGKNENGALWALRWMHQTEVVDGLISKLNASNDPKLRTKLLINLARLYTKEAPYDGSWWWGTQPDTRGPYYKPILWEASGKIESAYRTAYDQASDKEKKQLAAIATKHRMNLEGIGKMEAVKKTNPKQGEVGRTSIEDVMLALDKLKGDKKRGQQVLTGMACVACHNVKPGDPIKGPDLLNMKLTKEQIAEAILKPAATISETWVTATMNDGTIHSGTIVSKTNQQVIIHNIAGMATKLKTSDVKSINKQTSSLMGPHLADDLSLQQFADVIEYLHKKSPQQ